MEKQAFQQSAEDDALRIINALRASGTETGLSYAAIVARVVAELRKNRGLSQEQLSQEIEITQSSLSRIEKGDTVFTADHAILFAPAFGITPSQIFIIADRAVEWLKKRDLNVSAIKVGAAALLGPGAIGLLLGSVVAKTVASELGRRSRQAKLEKGKLAS